MPEIKTEFLFTIASRSRGLKSGRHCLMVTGASDASEWAAFEGPKLRGTVLPGGACWMLLRRDDALEIEDPDQRRD